VGLIPQRIQQRLKPLQDRVEPILRRFDWTWTTAVVFSIGAAFFALTTMAVIPSWFLYFAGETLKWNSFWLLKLRDLIATGIIGTSFIILLIATYLMQEWRRKLRGGGGESRPSGGYR
jgi:hypothetical protein